MMLDDVFQPFVVLGFEKVDIRFGSLLNASSVGAKVVYFECILK